MLVLGGSQRKGHSIPVLPNELSVIIEMVYNSALST